MDEADIITLTSAFIGAFGAFLISRWRRRKRQGPENDERTERADGKAARCTIVVLMVVMALVLWGTFFDLFTLGSKEVVSLLFFTMLFSMIGFRHYYLSKEL
jgi:uncharacterized membrane protein